MKEAIRQAKKALREDTTEEIQIKIHCRMRN